MHRKNVRKTLLGAFFWVSMLLKIYQNTSTLGSVDMNLFGHSKLLLINRTKTKNKQRKPACLNHLIPQKSVAFLNQV